MTGPSPAGYRSAHRLSRDVIYQSGQRASLKPALVLPRVSKSLTMGRSAEGEIKLACRLVSLRSEAAGVSSLG
jgi:hypothetical protein